MSGGGDLEQFIRQPFVGAVFGIMCFFGVLLVITIVLLVYIRRRRAQRQAAASPAAPAYAQADMADMPDLHLLVKNPTPAAPLPAVNPAPSAPPRAARKGTFTVAVADGSQAEAVEVMTVLRDVVDGRLIVQMGDKAYQNISANAEFKERFARVMRELGQIGIQHTPAPPAPSEIVPESPPAMPMTSKSLPPLDNLVQPPAAEPAPSKPLPPPMADGRMPGDLPSFKLDDNPMPKRKRGQKTEVKPVPEVNIAGAIEAYLQHKLRHTPEYAGRSIHIYPSPEGGVSIEVDGQYYDTVGEVADPQVRAFLSQTIEEWQERH